MKYPDPPPICGVLDAGIDFIAYPALVLVCLGILWAVCALVRSISGDDPCDS